MVEELAAKVQVVGNLEHQVEQLHASLADAQAEIQAKSSSIGELETAKANLEANYKDQLEASDKQRHELTSTITVQLAAAEEKVRKWCPTCG